MRARSVAVIRRAAAIRRNRGVGRQHPTASITKVVLEATVLGLFGAGVGAVWSLAFALSAGLGALCVGLLVFLVDLVLVPIDARLGRAYPLGIAAMAVLVGEMVLGAIVWAIRVAVE